MRSFPSPKPRYPNAESVRKFQPRVCFETLGLSKRFVFCLANIEPRRNSFRVASFVKWQKCTQGFKANPGLKLANAFSVNVLRY
jgi:hypothetical protein